MLFELKDITKVYGKKENAFKALDKVSISIKKGETVGIVGKSGSGKSTLMHVMASLDAPTAGLIAYEGRQYNKLSAKDLNILRNRTFGFVFQQFYLNPKETVLDNVALPLKIAGTPKKERDTKALKILKALGMDSKSKNRAADLSGGQKQRVCIARAMIADPDVIFADEPTGNLDTESGKQVIEELFKLNRNNGKTVIIVTHDEDIAALCNRRIRITDGKVEAAT